MGKPTRLPNMRKYLPARDIERFIDSRLNT